MPQTSFNDAVAAVVAARVARDEQQEANRNEHTAALELINKREQALRQQRADVDKVFYDREDAIVRRYSDAVHEANSFDS